jgi:glucose-1-phosphate cytidylyltransferase
VEKIDTVILAGGFGTRISEKTKIIPKPMISIGNDPILLHIIKKYHRAGIDSFVIATGYKFNIVNDFFKKKSLNYEKIEKNSFSFNYKIEKKIIKIKTIFTGHKTLTGTRILKIKRYIKTKKFFLTYGDGLSNVNLKELLNFHNRNKRIATITAVRPPVRFGELVIKNDLVTSFKEKPQLNDGWINGGFFVFEDNFFKIINQKQNVMLERQPLESLTKKKKLIAYKHKGFWQCMDTLRDYNILKKLNKKNAPWKK